MAHNQYQLMAVYIYIDIIISIMYVIHRIQYYVHILYSSTVNKVYLGLFLKESLANIFGCIKPNKTEM